MITLSNGHRFRWQCASGALGFDGRGWWWEYPLRWLGIIDPKTMTVVSKTVTLDPIEGRLNRWHPWTCVRLLPNGVVNNVGLTNPGIKVWVEEYYPIARRMGYTVAASIEAHDWESAFCLGLWLKDLDLAFVEVNVSCPNIGKVAPADMVGKVVRGLSHAAPTIPIVLKLSFGQTQDEELLLAINEMESVQAVHAINSVPWEVMFPDRNSPVGGGGVSGQYIHTVAVQAVRNVVREVPNKPVIAGGGITDRSGVERFMEAGASAFSFGTVFLKRPWVPNQIIRDFGGCRRGS